METSACGTPIELGNHFPLRIKIPTIGKYTQHSQRFTLIPKQTSLLKCDSRGPTSIQTTFGTIPLKLVAEYETSLKRFGVVQLTAQLRMPLLYPTTTWLVCRSAYQVSKTFCARFMLHHFFSHSSQGWNRPEWASKMTLSATLAYFMNPKVPKHAVLLIYCKRAESWHHCSDTTTHFPKECDLSSAHRKHFWS
eukprot:330573-Amphidinium_carterae.1